MLMLQLTLIPRILGRLYETTILGSVYTECLKLNWILYICLLFGTPTVVCCQKNLINWCVHRQFFRFNGLGKTKTKIFFSPQTKSKKTLNLQLLTKSRGNKKTHLTLTWHTNEKKKEENKLPVVASPQVCYPVLFCFVFFKDQGTSKPKPPTMVQYGM